ncbi:MAG: hypothetical protein AB8B85_22970 [Paracoccaceae bacterium]
MAEQQPSRKRTKAQERALVLLLAGCVLLLPPGAQIFQIEAKIAGIPVVLAVLFLLWAGMIVGALASARALSSTDRDEDFGP